MKKLLAAIALTSLMALEGAANQVTVDGRTWIYTVVDGGAQIGFGDEGLPGHWNHGVDFDWFQYRGLIPEGGFTTGGWPILKSDLKIPSELGGMPVTSIGAMALVKLYFDAGGNVTIPEGVKSIGMGAFCTGESILHMTLPSSLTHIGEGAFQWCKSLREITIPSGVKVIADQTFWGCSALRSVTIQEGVTSIGEGAFWGCLKYKGSGSHSEITIPSSVTSIGARAFEGCEVEVVRVSSDEYIERLKQMLAASGLDVSKVRFEVIGQTDDPPGGQTDDPTGDEPESPGDEIETYESQVDVAKGEVAPFEDAAQVYEGYLFCVNEIVGSVQVKVAKGKTDRKTGVFSAKVTATVQRAAEAKKLSFKGGVADRQGSVSTMTDKNGHSLAISVGVKGLAGKLDGIYEIRGARSIFAGNSDKLAVDDAMRLYQGTYNVVFGDGMLSVTVGKKGKTKISGTVNGRKVSATSQLSVYDHSAVVPVVIAKGTELSFTLWIKAGGTTMCQPGVLNGMTLNIVNAGKVGKLASGSRFALGVVEDFELAKGFDRLYTEYLPNVSVVQDGKKLIVANGAKAGKLVYDKKKGAIDSNKSKFTANMSGLKLTYKEKDGTFNGSFKAYGLVKGKFKAVTAKVTGVMINGCCYGEATIKNGGTVSVEISPKASSMSNGPTY